MSCKKGAGWSSSKKDSLIDVEPMCGVLASDAHTRILITNTLERDDIPPRSLYGHASEWFHHSEDLPEPYGERGGVFVFAWRSHAQRAYGGD